MPDWILYLLMLAALGFVGLLVVLYLAMLTDKEGDDA